MLLGAVVPDLRFAADAVASDLHQLMALKNEKAKERDRMRVDLLARRGEDAHPVPDRRQARPAHRINRCVGGRTAPRDRSCRSGDEPQGPDRAHGKGDRRGGAGVRRGREGGRGELAGSPEGHRPTSLGSADRLAPAIAFADAKGLLPKPVNGTVLRRFGDDDGLGARVQGISIATRSGAQVNSPSDGWVVMPENSEVTDNS